MEKTTITLDHGIYGKPQVTAYAKGGLAVHRRSGSGGWAVTHIATGLAVAGSPRYFATKARAVEVMAKLLALPVEWHKSFDDMRQSFTANAAAIRAAAFSA